jgi:hypothetical protein
MPRKRLLLTHLFGAERFCVEMGESGGWKRELERGIMETMKEPAS